jgi:hypothetical protein
MAVRGSEGGGHGSEVSYSALVPPCWGIHCLHTAWVGGHPARALPLQPAHCPLAVYLSFKTYFLNLLACAPPHPRFIYPCFAPSHAALLLLLPCSVHGRLQLGAQTSHACL